MKVAVVGTGLFARITALPGIALAKGIELAGVHDLNPDAAKAASEQYGVTAFGSIGELLAAKPDLVYLGTPPSSHAALLDEVIGAGLNVLCEKPMCLTPEEVERALRQADAKGLLHAVDHEWRFTSAYRTIRKLVRDGMLGDIRNVNVAINVNYGNVEGWPSFYANWATLLAESGGVMPQILSHFIDLFEFMFGGLEASGAALSTMVPQKPKSASDPTPARVDAEDSCALSGFLPNAAPVAISATWMARASAGAQWTITGSDQTLIYRTVGQLNGGRLGLVTPEYDLAPVEQLPEYDPAVSHEDNDRLYQQGLFAAELEAIAAALAEGRTDGPFANFRDELAVRRNIAKWRETGIRSRVGV